MYFDLIWSEMILQLSDLTFRATFLGGGGGTGIFKIAYNKKIRQAVAHPNLWESRQDHLTGHMRRGRLQCDVVTLFRKAKCHFSRIGHILCTFGFQLKTLKN